MPEPSQSESVCACSIHSSGRGVQPCLYHADVFREHQQMYRALRDIEMGTLNAGDDPGLRAGRALFDVKWRHV